MKYYRYETNVHGVDAVAIFSSVSENVSTSDEIEKFDSIDEALKGVITQVYLKGELLSVDDILNSDIAIKYYRDDAIAYINSKISEIREQYSRPDASQAQAYLEAEQSAKRIVSGDADDADIEFITARDVKTGTIDPKTKKPVRDVKRAAELIVSTADLWRGVLRRTDIARREAIAKFDDMASEKGYISSLDLLFK